MKHMFLYIVLVNDNLTEIRPILGICCDPFRTLTPLSQEIKRESERTRDLSDPPPPPDLQIPQCVSNIDSARLFLAHSGILTPKMFDDSDQSPSVVLLKNRSVAV